MLRSVCAINCVMACKKNFIEPLKRLISMYGKNFCLRLRMVTHRRPAKKREVMLALSFVHHRLQVIGQSTQQLYLVKSSSLFLQRTLNLRAL